MGKGSNSPCYLSKASYKKNTLYLLIKNCFLPVRSLTHHLQQNTVKLQASIRAFVNQRFPMGKMEKPGVRRMWDKQAVTAGRLPVIAVDGVCCPQQFSFLCFFSANL